MCSIATAPRTRTAASLAALIAHAAEVNEAIAATIADPAFAAELASIPGDALAAHTTALLGAADRATAAATVMVGQVEVSSGAIGRRLIAGRYASVKRWLEVEAGLAPKSATAMQARAGDLRIAYTRVAEAWLAGEVSGDAVRETCVGITGALRTVGADERIALRHEALDHVLPVAIRGTVADVKKAVGALRLVVDPDGASQAAMDAYDDQRLTCSQVGNMTSINAWVAHDTAAAIMTVLTQTVDGWYRAGRLAPEDQLPSGVDPGSWDGRRMRRARTDHLHAIALGEVMTGLLDDARVGSHHGIAPHVTLTVDLEQLQAGLGGELTIPGRDYDTLLATESVRRILCDADLTTVITRRTALFPDADADANADGCGVSLADRLLQASREVLYVGRAQRTVPPRLRRALEARDQHCIFPGCRAHVRRCHAHHVTAWENGGGSDLDNTILLCVRHHHAVHEGRWTITPRPGASPGSTDYSIFTPPDRRRRP